MAAAAGVRLIAPDRPGIGGSDRRPWRRPIDWVEDVRALADALGLDRFAVLGWSAGGPHALACGHHLGERVTAVGLASPAAGWFIGHGATPDVHLDGRRVATVAGSVRWWARLLLGDTRRRVDQDPEEVVAGETRNHSPADREILERPPVRSMMAAALVEQFRQGMGGIRDEAMAIARPWGFDPGAVRVPVLLWHGEADTTVSAAAARGLASRLASCRATFYPGAGHYLVLEHWSDILHTLAAAAQ